MTQNAQTLKQHWTELKQQQPNIRIRNAAKELKVSEAELLATQSGESVTRLRPEFSAILGDVTTLGRVMALTRNDDIVHERKGIYLNPELNNPYTGLFTGEDIDLRIFFKPWAYAFAVTESQNDRPRYSLQFFAVDGEAIHKIYLTPNSNIEAYQELARKFRADSQSQELIPEAWPAPSPELPDNQIDIVSLQNGWVNLKNTLHFSDLLKRHNVTRTQALRLAPQGNYAVKVSNNILHHILEGASEKDVPVMVFVGNKGIIQIHTGPVKKLLDRDGWFNVLDPDFNLHIREAGITQSWIVRKPSDDGMVTSLECFDAKGELLLQMFGKREPGIPELDSWRTLVNDIEATNA